jgi:hypothetical protein
MTLTKKDLAAIQAMIDQSLEKAPETSRALPPMPKKRGKRLLGEKGDIRVRVDAVLAELFQKEVTQHGGNASAAMDKILWNYFGKPRLSFETIDPGDTD